MPYQYDLMLTKTAKRSYSLVVIKTNKVFLLIKANSDREAMMKAIEHMSSWNSVRIRWEQDIQSDSNETEALEDEQ